MKKASKAYVTLVLTEGFYIIVYKNTSIYLTKANILKRQKIYREFYYESYVYSTRAKKIFRQNFLPPKPWKVMFFSSVIK